MSNKWLAVVHMRILGNHPSYLELHITTKAAGGCSITATRKLTTGTCLGLARLVRFDSVRLTVGQLVS